MVHNLHHVYENMENGREDDELAKIEREKEKKQQKRSLFYQIIDFPLNCLAYLTILPINEKTYSRMRCYICSFTGTAFLIALFDRLELTITALYFWMAISTI